VPDEFWVKTSRETDNPWQQYNTLKQWAETGTQLIRNVKLFEMSGNPQWVESRPTPRALDGVEVCAKCDQPAYHHDPSCFVRIKPPRQ
jgi:hypothetical protein